MRASSSFEVTHIHEQVCDFGRLVTVYDPKLSDLARAHAGMRLSLCW